MAEVPEHLLKRSQRAPQGAGPARRGRRGRRRAAEAPAPTRGRSARRPRPRRRAAPRRAADAGDVDHRRRRRRPRAPARAVAQAQGRARGRRRRRRRGRGGGSRRPRPPRAATATAPAPSGTGPGGHTQRLLTVVKSGSIQQTRAEAQDKVHVWPHLLVDRVRVDRSSCTAFVTIFSALVKAPLLGLADVNQTPNPSKAPWYFLGLQELLTMFHPMVAGVTIPGIGSACSWSRPMSTRTLRTSPTTASSRSAIFTLFLMFWAVLVIIGSFFRGTGLQLRLPVERRHLLRAVGADDVGSRRPDHRRRRRWSLAAVVAARHRPPALDDRAPEPRDAQARRRHAAPSTAPSWPTVERVGRGRRAARRRSAARSHRRRCRQAAGGGDVAE